MQVNILPFFLRCLLSWIQCAGLQSFKILNCLIFVAMCRQGRPSVRFPSWVNLRRTVFVRICVIKSKVFSKTFQLSYVVITAFLQRPQHSLCLFNYPLSTRFLTCNIKVKLFYYVLFYLLLLLLLIATIFYIFMQLFTIFNLWRCFSIFNSTLNHLCEFLHSFFTIRYNFKQFQPMRWIILGCIWLLRSCNSLLRFTGSQLQSSKFLLNLYHIFKLVRADYRLPNVLISCKQCYLPLNLINSSFGWLRIDCQNSIAWIFSLKSRSLLLLDLKRKKGIFIISFFT